MGTAPVAGDPLLEELAALDASLTRVLAVASRPGDATTALARVEAAQRRLAAVRFKVVAAGEAQRAAAREGSPTTTAWVAHDAGGRSGRGARRGVGVGARSQPGG